MGGPKPLGYEWSFIDETFNALDQQNIAFRAGLCRFGLLDWIGNLQIPGWSKLFVQFRKTFSSFP